jgi:Leucine-rich repeat (LRR) protein
LEKWVFETAASINSAWDFLRCFMGIHPISSSGTFSPPANGDSLSQLDSNIRRLSALTLREAPISESDPCTEIALFAKHHETGVPHASLTEQSSKEEVEIYLYRWSRETPNLIGLDLLGLSVAMSRIMKAFDSAADSTTTLDLSCLQLTNLPVEIFKLKPIISSVKTLDLSHNKLTYIPPEIGNLVGLQHLTLNENQIATLPPEIGSLRALESLNLRCNQLSSLTREMGNLILLQSLNLEVNKLTSIPSEIGGLISLKDLKLRYNDLSSLPAEMGNLTQLSKLSFDNNRKLRTLPITLGFCRNITTLDITHTDIERDARDRILATTYALRQSASLADLPEKLLLWHSFARVTPVVNLERLSREQQGQVYEWLIRLEKTSDFDSYQAKLAQHVCGMLKSVVESLTFKHLFFAELSANLTHCSDRAAMLFNILYIGWRLESICPQAPISDTLQLLASGARTMTLRAALAQRIHAQEKSQGRPEGESVEIYLYYETHLMDELKLLSAIQSSSYATKIGPRKYINRDDLATHVQNSYFDYLFELTAFQELFKADNHDQLNQISTRMYQALDDLGPPPLGEDFSNDVIKHKTEMGELLQQKNSQEKALAFAWYQSKLAKAPA